MVFFGALLMTWPALYNGYALVYPDSMTYIGQGATVARALFLHKTAGYSGMRSFIYSLGILPWHWKVTLWPVVAFQALITAYVLWLVLRSFVSRRTVSRYLVLVAILSAITSVSWYASLVMPDFLGALLYLCIYLLVFARSTISRAQCVVVGVIAWWGITAHATHLILATGMCILLLLLLTLRRPIMRGRLRPVCEIVAIVLLAAGAQLALHTYLYGEPTLNGDRPPFLMSRIIADGPGAWYLQTHCPGAKFVICNYVGNFSEDSDDFIWGDKGIWQTADEDTRKKLSEEEFRFVLAVIRAYPRAQLSKSAANFWGQLNAFGLWDLDASDWVKEVFEETLPGGLPRYLKSRQARNALPFDFFTNVHYWTVYASLVAIGGFTIVLWRRKPAQLRGLCLAIFPVVIANAFVTGAMSTVEDRYEARIIWLVPLVAGSFVMEWLRYRGEAREGQGNSPIGKE